MSKAERLRAELEAAEDRAASLRLELGLEEESEADQLRGTSATGRAWAVGRVPASPERTGLEHLVGRYMVVVQSYGNASLVVEDLQAMQVALDAAEADARTTVDLQRILGKAPPWPDETIPF